MKIRSTEKPHFFTEKLYKSIPIYDLQGLTLDSNYNFTGGIEAVEFNAEETINIKSIFRKEEWIAKLCLCNQLSVPLYVVTYKSWNTFISIYELHLYKKRDGYDVQIFFHKKLELNKFADWWSELKGTEQSKPLYEAARRISYFDQLLAKRRLAWGGNIDGFLLNSDMRTQAIIETRYTTKNPLEVYDPAIFYPPHYTRAGDYKTWEPLVLLASELNIPLFLFTFERKSDEDRLGFAIIDYISKEELKYHKDPPHKNIIKGIENINKEIKKNISKQPPTIH